MQIESYMVCFCMWICTISCWFMTVEILTLNIYGIPLVRLKPSKWAGLILQSANLLPPLTWGVIVTLGVSSNCFRVKAGDSKLAFPCKGTSYGLMAAA
jgi:hypothetical protein